jgi:hypothetical protein
MNTTKSTPALSLAEVYLTLQPTPLINEVMLAAFYREEINYVRGDQVQRLAQGLKRAAGSDHFKALLMGHPGVGKSTELSRLSSQLASQFRVIRFSAVHNIDPNNFSPLDILLVMMAELATKTSQPIEDGGAGKIPAAARLQEIWDWFTPEQTGRSQSISEAVTIMEVGVKAQEDYLWEIVLALFTNLQNEMKFAASRQKEIVEQRMNRLPALLEIANRLLDDCNDLLRAATGCEWLFCGEDFDKKGIPGCLIENLFINYAHLFRGLRAHLIFTLPISLYYSSKASQLPFTGDQCLVLKETPMFYQDHRPNMKGQWATADVLTARMLSSLFDTDQMERLIVASGGNLPDLFTLVNYATNTADLRGDKMIGADDAHDAIVNLRNDYERRLGHSPEDAEQIDYQKKADRLLKIYHGDQLAQVTDEVTYSLLRSRALQEFSGEYCFGVHPLVVDILANQGLITRPATGIVPGGTN